ncbi:TonB-dependent receptor [Azotobacter sp. CWF10]
MAQHPGWTAFQRRRRQRLFRSVRPPGRQRLRVPPDRPAQGRGLLAQLRRQPRQAGRAVAGLRERGLLGHPVLRVFRLHLGPRPRRLLLQRPCGRRPRPPARRALDADRRATPVRQPGHGISLPPTSRLRFNYGWNENAYSDYQADPNAYNPATGELRRRFRSNPDVERTRNYASLDWLNDLELGGMRHELALGADHERHDESNGFFYQGPNTWGFDPESPHYGDLKQDKVVNPGNSQQRSRVRMLSAYVKDNIHIGEQWILSLGLRHQRFRQRDWAGIPSQIGTNLNKSKNLPFVGLVYKLDDEFSLYANYSESYKPNVIASGTLVESGSDPEEGRQYEIGLRYDNGWLSGLVALFDIRKENIQTTETINGEQITRAIGEARSRGLEASLNGQLGERWNLVANYAYTDTEVLEDSPANEGNELVNVAHNVAGLFLSYDLPQSVLPGALRLGGGARYVGSREGDSANSFELSGYTTYDAFATWTLPNVIGKKTELQLNVDNLTNKEYFISSGGTSNRVSWGAARTATLSATVDF